MSYDKLSLDSFKASLKEGKYKNATGARRGVGKATTLSESEKETARKMIDKHFGADAAASAPVAKKAEKAEKSEKKAEKKAAAKPAKAPTEKKAAAKSSKDEPVAKRPYNKRQPQIAPAANIGHGTISEDSEMTRMHLAERTLTASTSALNALTAAKPSFPGEFDSAAAEINDTIRGAVSIFRSIVGNMKGHQVSSVISERAPAAAKGNGNTKAPVVTSAGPRVEAQDLFDESNPS